MNRLVVLVVALALLTLGVPALAASGEPPVQQPIDEGVGATGDLRKSNKHALHDFADSHTGDPQGHIAQNLNYGFTMVGHSDLGGVTDGRYTDVWSSGDYAYVGTFDEPTCDRSGVYVVDISDPASPTVVSHIPSPPNTRVNDVKTVELDTRTFTGTVLIHTLEPCGLVLPGLGANPSQLGQGGISLWDVTDPTRPHALKQNFLNFGVHNTYPWVTNDGAYLLAVNDISLTDTYVVDISQPQAPQVVAATGLPDWPTGCDDGQCFMGNFAFPLLHDVWVDYVDGKWVGVLSYWDAGFITLDLDDPQNPVFMDDSTYPDPDPVTGFMPPEGNGHAAVFNSDGSYIFAGDEDFDVQRVAATYGPAPGTEFDVIQGSNVPQIDAANPLAGTIVYVGLACGASIPNAPAAGGPYVALVQRGTCSFTEKAQNVDAAGYDGGIVFNANSGSEPLCEGLVFMLAEAGIPFVFTQRSTGFGMFDITYDPNDCPEPGTEFPIDAYDGSNLEDATGPDVSITATFDGWSYFHLLDVSDEGSLFDIQDMGWYAPQEVNNPAFADGFGDLSMHNLEGHPSDPDLAFISWYSLGMRAVRIDDTSDITSPGGTPTDPCEVSDYYSDNVREVGRWIDTEGSNFWGVHVAEDGHILASDRNTGLWIFSYVEPSCNG